MDNVKRTIADENTLATGQPMTLQMNLVLFLEFLFN